ncbi:hypothetical protein DFR70_106259 [Nocardia tenerifensis]|uniref:Resolvase-like protein n=1 Tax=Nocardia tenerifensis TaxID=228006 RepID=A0A318JYY9_9NOCA|nr:hypothetical protein [Nocardia tenerifensis]PXX63199.1 hypothetical protein DFR70_106259 [Nocardia tenerifensis]
MRRRPAAVGYLRRDVSGARQQWDEVLIRSLAQRFGYDLAKTVVFSAETDDPVERLAKVARRLSSEVVIVPSTAHFGGDVPGELVQVCDVITVAPEYTYARRPDPPYAEDARGPRPA